MSPRPVVACWFACACIDASAGAFAFSPDVIAAAPGGTSGPRLFLMFAGDGLTTDAQWEFSFDPALFSVQATPRNNALCLVGSNFVRLISPASSTPLASEPRVYCELRVQVSAVASHAAYDLPSLAKDVECSNPNSVLVPCSAPDGTAVLRVGVNSPQAQWAFSPLEANEVLFDDAGNAQITADYVSGAEGASVEWRDCSILNDSGGSFGIVQMDPVPFGFGAQVSGTGDIQLTCVRDSADQTASLRCSEERNAQAFTTRSWNLRCPALPPDFLFADEFESLN
jgi:hypothetical protein